MWKNKSAYLKPQCFPTRLIEICGPQEIRIHESTADELGQYACLSYCWGENPHKQLRTTKRNLPQHKKSLDWSTLPLTFQDALNLTDSLGLRYLWIDSLCIVQDDEEDWRHEGAKMASIYSNSYITFAAANSTSSEGGLFSSKSNDKVIEIQTADSKFGIRMKNYIHSSESWKSMPLTKRAWFFQERFLSPQIVYFAYNELYWEDANTRACECSGILASMTQRIPRQLEIVEPRFGWWHRVVQQYTNMELSFERDIFPALQGVAKIVQQYRRCAYYAGLWENTLLDDMLWHRPSPCVRPQTYRAPTWSWASVRGRVEYTEKEMEACAVVHSPQTKPVSQSALGQVQGGSLKIRAPGLRAVVSNKHDQDLLIKSNSGNEDAHWWLPDVKDELQNTEVVLLRMAIVASGLGYSHGIVFRSAGDRDGVYERIGYVLWRPELSKGFVWEEMEITVI